MINKRTADARKCDVTCFLLYCKTPNWSNVRRKKMRREQAHTLDKSYYLVPQSTVPLRNVQVPLPPETKSKDGERGVTRSIC